MATQFLREFVLEPSRTCMLSTVFGGPELTPSASEEEAKDGSCAKGILVAAVLEIAAAIFLYYLWHAWHIHH